MQRTKNILGKKEYLFQDGVKGNVVLYDDKTIKVFFNFPLSVVKERSEYYFSDELIELSVHLNNFQKTTLSFTDYIHSCDLQVEGKKKGITYYNVEIKSREPLCQRSFGRTIPRMALYQTNFNLCQHQSRNQSRCCSMGVKSIYGGGGCSPR